MAGASASAPGWTAREVRSRRRPGQRGSPDLSRSRPMAGVNTAYCSIMSRHSVPQPVLGFAVARSTGQEDELAVGHYELLLPVSVSAHALAGLRAPGLASALPCLVA